ncbi:hypothetical protein [Serratia sp. UGAL515B_01]|uniref:hypothetical protein n=1 Tax=Serratia sp. UGAL515B_01 TaxID=2986763 RepID=UPI0029535F7E|nr:hypothetical protein [Serratia sp. UGAL515B_01]WON78756.1 hypothetical protein OK023_09115 [Serratia sp. UGAL515B_01]
MNISIKAWLLSKIDEYKFSLRDTTVDFYMAETALRRPECNVNHLRHYNNVSLTLANLCLENGDDESYLLTLGKLHNRLILEINNSQRCQLFRIQSYHFSRYSLTLICQKYSMEGVWEKANALQQDFAKRVPFQL